MANVLAGLATGQGAGGLNDLISQFEQADLLLKGGQPTGWGLSRASPPFLFTLR